MVRCIFLQEGLQVLLGSCFPALQGSHPLLQVALECGNITVKLAHVAFRQAVQDLLEGAESLHHRAQTLNRFIGLQLGEQLRTVQVYVMKYL